MSGEQSAPLVTVITATYNASATLRLALESVVNQDFSDFEAWIVGDACTDDSEAVVRSFGDPRLRWLNLDRNSGNQSRPNNEGLRLARGRYIAYLNHDDLWLPWHLSGLVDFIEETRADFGHSLSVAFGPEGVESWAGPPRVRHTYEHRAIPPSSWLHRRQLVEEIGLWRDSELLAIPVDFDFLRRAYRAGKVFGFYPRPTVLQFRSSRFRTYALRGEPPQARYCEALRKGPAELERRVLQQLFLACDRKLREVVESPPAAMLVRALKAMRQRALDRYGRERWPLGTYLVWRYQQRRQALRPQRGLPAQR
jgi:glycosyltransferase involved in cell wall biosynthesis